MAITAIATQDTLLKSLPGDSAAGCVSEKVKEGDHLTLKNYVMVNALAHLYMELPEDTERCSRWWAYAPHWRVGGTEPGNNPTESVPNTVETKEVEEKPITLTVPGISARLGIDTPIYWDGNQPSKFTWGEATKNGERIPTDPTITANIIQVAKYMDKVRKDLGDNPIAVTSWYRDPITNRRVGGARWSQHLQGNAIDFYVVGEDVVDTFYKLKKFKGGQLTLAVGNGFVHLDLRPGGPSRWTYPGGPRVSLW